MKIRHDGHLKYDPQIGDVLFQVTKNENTTN